MNAPHTTFATPSTQADEELAIAVRAYTTTKEATKATPAKGKASRRAKASEWTLVFDTETTVDARQALRFGSYLVFKHDRLIERGLFHDPEVLTGAEVALLQEFAGREGLLCRTVGQFIEEVFFRFGYELRATICGVNLPFDISRLALKVGTARSRAMSPGFTFTLSDHRWRPNVQIKHLNARSSLMQFTKPPRKPETRREWKAGAMRAARRGCFIDLKTHAAALTSRSFSLASLADFLQIENGKLDTNEHGGPLTENYLRYAVRDVEVTWECYRALRDKLKAHGLRQTDPSAIQSEAGIGKGYLKEMGIRPLSELPPNVSPQLLGIIWSTFYGGRAEVRWRREICRVLYCDFLSMYPTVCTLMGLFRFVTAKGFSTRDATEETRAFVDGITRADLKAPSTWGRLATLVAIHPEGDILPVRARYAGQQQAATIGLNHLTADAPLWFTLADVVASKLLTGRTPEIVEAIAFAPEGQQDDLRPINLLGRPEYRVDPTCDDLFKRVIDMRNEVKERLARASGHEREVMKAQEQALKILANSTSYGIYAEVNVEHGGSPEHGTCYGPRGMPIPISTTKTEKPGRYSHPLLASLITGAARLMLAVAETLVHEADLEWAFCDTDSMAIAKPDGMDDETFLERALAVSGWFEDLNPYERKGPLFKLESQNLRLDGGRHLEPLFCFAVSAKRYALFNVGPDGLPILRKASAHGLGHLLAPYGEDDPSPAIPPPRAPLAEIGVARWQHDLWFQILCAALAGHPDRVDLGYHPALSQPAASRYGATSPDLLNWFAAYNRGRPYQDQVKPFNFLIGCQAKRAIPCDEEFVIGPRKRGRKPKTEEPKPIAPYDKSVAVAAGNVFDRVTGRPISPALLKSYADAILGYHLSPENKFANGDHFDRGLTRRRHIRARKVELIGKEADRIEEAMEADLDDTEISYGIEGDVTDIDERFRKLVDALGQRSAAARLGVSRTALIKALRMGVGSLTVSVRARLVAAL